MAVISNHGRQWKVWAVQDILGAAVGTNTYTIKLPPGAILTDLSGTTVTAFDSATSAAMTVGDGTTTFISAVDVKSAGVETATVVPKMYPSGGTLTVSFAIVGATTAGEVVITVGYLQVGKVDVVVSQ